MTRRHGKTYTKSDSPLLRLERSLPVKTFWLRLEDRFSDYGFDDFASDLRLLAPVVVFVALMCAAFWAAFIK